jgi:uncharacterized membrane protein
VTAPGAHAARPTARDLARWLLAVFLLAAGTAHFVVPDEFLAQTPTWLPARTAIVYVSGIVELLLGVALLVVRARRETLGWVVAAFFVLVLPGNVHQAVSGTPAFGLDTDAARWGRLAFQPVLVWWAWWSTRVPAAGPDAARAPDPSGR